MADAKRHGRDHLQNRTFDQRRLMSREVLAEKRRTQGPYTYATQLLLNPKGDEMQEPTGSTTAWASVVVVDEDRN